MQAGFDSRLWLPSIYGFGYGVQSRPLYSGELPIHATIVSACPSTPLHPLINTTSEKRSSKAGHGIHDATSERLLEILIQSWLPAMTGTEPDLQTRSQQFQPLPAKLPRRERGRVSLPSNPDLGYLFLE